MLGFCYSSMTKALNKRGWKTETITSFVAFGLYFLLRGIDGGGACWEEAAVVTCTYCRRREQHTTPRHHRCLSCNRARGRLKTLREPMPHMLLVFRRANRNDQQKFVAFAMSKEKTLPRTADRQTCAKACPRFCV